MNNKTILEIKAPERIISFWYPEEVMLLRRIAELTVAYSRQRLLKTRLELFRLAHQWEKEWKDKGLP